MKKLVITASLFLALAATTLTAGTVKLPADMPAATVAIPDNWEPEEDDNGGILAESPDNVTTVYFDIVASKDELDETVEASLKWLMEDHKVSVNAESKEEKELEIGGRTYQMINFDGESKEWGPAEVGFFFTPVGQNHVLVITYWVSKENAEKSVNTLFEKILPSVKSVE